MFTLIVNVSFSGAHYLRGYDGPCARVHGHNFRVEARVSGTDLDDVGIVVDFKAIKALLKEVTDRFDHRLINEVAPFDTLNPTAENVARYIFDEVSPGISRAGATLESIGMWETHRYGVVYKPGR